MKNKLSILWGAFEVFDISDSFRVINNMDHSGVIWIVYCKCKETSKETCCTNEDTITLGSTFIK